jgi:hypothetical protein
LEVVLEAVAMGEQMPLLEAQVAVVHLINQAAQEHQDKVILVVQAAVLRVVVAVVQEVSAVRVEVALLVVLVVQEPLLAFQEVL